MTQRHIQNTYAWQPGKVCRMLYGAMFPCAARAYN